MTVLHSEVADIYLSSPFFQNSLDGWTYGCPDMSFSYLTLKCTCFTLFLTITHRSYDYMQYALYQTFTYMYLLIKQLCITSQVEFIGQFENIVWLTH